MEPPKQLLPLRPNSTLVDVSKTVTHNYTLYHTLAEQLKSLQDWVQRIEKENNHGNGGTKGSEKEIR